MYKKMKKKLIGVIAGVLVLINLPMPIQAAEASNAVLFDDIAVTRTNEQREEILNIYKQLFPEEYEAIIKYENVGTTELESGKVEVLVYKTRELEGVDYELTIMNNGQVFMNYSNEEVCDDTILPKGAAYGTRYVKSFTVGDLEHYNTFTIEYLIKDTEFDEILSCTNVTGSGFLLYPTNLSKKMKEDVNGPAHYGYNNVRMSDGTTSVMYDLGVGVGKNKAKGITQISSGGDMWLWSLIYAFFFD